MKTKSISGRCSARASDHGVTLIECLVYITLLGAISGVAFLSLGRLWTATGRLRQNADDLQAALRAGEQWRGDMQSARGPVEALADGSGCRIRGSAGMIEWRWEAGGIRRHAVGPDAVWLTRVRRSGMSEEMRERVKCWRWELALEPHEKRVRMEPIFTFVAVPGGVLNPP